MNGLDLERIFELIDSSATLSRDGSVARQRVLEYVQHHREEILKALENVGEAEIPTGSGDEKLVIRRAA